MKTVLKILFAPLLWLAHACSPLGDPIDEEKSDNHYYNNSKSEIRYSPMGNWFELGNTPMDADIESFEVLNRYFGKDKNSCYYKANTIVKGTVDVATFHVKGNEYMSFLGFDKNHAYTFEKVYGKVKKGVKALIIEGADPKTYTHTDFDWANDGKHRFYRYKMIPGDYETFEVLNENFSKDKNTVFHQYGENIVPIAADLSSFETMGEDPIAKDKFNVYCMSFKGSTKNKLITIPRTPGDTVENLNSMYIRVGTRIYHWGAPVANANATSFEVVNFHYAKDANHVFYKGEILNDADVVTFGILEERGIGDKNGPFREGKRFER